MQIVRNTGEFGILKDVQKATLQNDLEQNLAEIQRKIESAASKSGRDPNEIKLVAVSKTHPVSTLRDAISAGAKILGENKVQEAESKIEEIGVSDCEWHLIGHLQKNKARKAVELFDVIHSIDSIELAKRLERICVEEDRAALKVFVQVDVAREETKSGILENNLPEIIEFLQNCECLKLVGLMIIPPYFEDAEKVRPFFEKLREIRDEILPDGELSMGMSHDFEIAIEEGATFVRVGTAIFGSRNYS